MSGTLHLFDLARPEVDIISAREWEGWWEHDFRALLARTVGLPCFAARKAIWTEVGYMVHDCTGRQDINLGVTPVGLFLRLRTAEEQGCARPRVLACIDKAMRTVAVRAWVG